MNTAERSARAALLAATEGEDPRVHELVRRLGLVEASVQIASEIDGAEILKHAAELDVRLVIPGDDEWPTQLDALPLPPWGLFVRGQENLRFIAARSVAIVGSRAATGYGMRVAADLAADLCEQGWSVISGLAFGIDAAAHRGALAVRGTTAAVLAGGVDSVYPSSNTDLGQRILESGVLISEVPPGIPPMRHRFLTRNRLIAALTRGTVIVEAAHRSGSLRTAAAAESLLRPVMAVPGSVDSAASAGTHRWIAERRAELVTCAADVLALVGDLDSGAVQVPLLAEREQTVLAVLTQRPQTVDRIASAARASAPEAMAALGVLAMLGLARQQSGRWLCAQRADLTPTDQHASVTT